MQTLRPALAPLLFVLACALPAAAKGPKVHTVTLGPAHNVPYTPPQATTGANSGASSTLRIRDLDVNGVRQEWTLGEVHDVTDRTFVVRRALRINDSLPAEPVHWAWQPGPWLMVDRISGHITALHLPYFDPLVSDVVWFRDDAAYCGIATTAKGAVVAVIAKLGVRQPIVHKRLAPWPQPSPSQPVCAPAIWQRAPMRATLQLTGGQPVTYDVVGSVSLVEQDDNSDQ